MLARRPVRSAISLLEMLVTVVIVGIVIAMSTLLFSAAADYVASLQRRVNAAKHFVTRRERPSRPTTHLIPNQYVVMLHANSDSHAVVQRLSKQIPLHLLEVYANAFKGFAARVPAAHVAALVKDPDVQFVEQDQTLALAQVSKVRPSSGVRRINLWPSPFGGRSIDADVAIIDTGVDATQPALNVVLRKGFGYDDATDIDGHGTQVAGILAAKDQRIGVAPGARIWALKVLHGDGFGAASNIVNALDFVASRADEIDVVNISVSTTTRSPAINAAAARCIEAGVVVVAAAGNSSRDISDISPASEPGVIAVAAFADSDGRPGTEGGKTSLGDEDDSFARSFSNYGPLVDFVAPGVDLTTLDVGDLRMVVSGTSFAAPHVAGLAALLRDPVRPLMPHTVGTTDDTPAGIRRQLDAWVREFIPGPGRTALYPLIVAPSLTAPVMAMAVPPKLGQSNNPVPVSGQQPAFQQSLELFEVASPPIVANPSMGLWQLLDELPAPALPTTKSYIKPTRFQAFKVDYDALRAFLANAPLEFTAPGRLNPLQIALPMPDGSFARFNIVESPIMEPGLAAQFPEIKTYGGQGVDDPSATLRMDITPFGFHVQVLSPKGAFYIDPNYHLENNPLISYYSKDLVPTGKPPTRGVVRDPQPVPPLPDVLLAPTKPQPSLEETPLKLARTGPQLRTYRTAVAATGEYTAFHGGSVAAGQSAIVTAMNRVSGIYEVEFTIRMTLVANNNLLVYTNAATDPYNNTNPVVILGQNQSNIDAIIGSSNYDVGHVFSTGSGGLAALAAVGVPGVKAQGTTGTSTPVGDPFYVDFVAHEFGHQFAANHTFNVGDPNRNGPTAYEPGSGSTIMGYAGLFGINDLQPNSDPYFHSVSFDEVLAFVSSGPGFTSATITSTGNTQPTVNAGIDYTIPAGTPFTLTASATDVNGDALTYCWEQRDLGPAQTLAAADNGSSPLFRSFNPTPNPKRTFPRLSDIINNISTPGEKLPTLARTMDFRVTVRDNRAGGGGVNTDDMVVTVVGGASFQVTSPNTAVTWPASSSQTVTWNVAGSNVAPISTAIVNILMSTDGGLTFPTTLVANTPNDGSQTITVPSVTSSTVRIMVEGVGNIFFDMSDVNFTIGPSVAAGVTVTQSAGSTAVTEGGATDSYTVVLTSAPTANVTINLTPGTQLTVAPATLTFTPANWNVPQTVTVTAVDDAAAEGAHSGVISHTAVSADTSYNGITIGTVTASITDNDPAAVAGVTITQSGGSTAVAEGGATDTFTVVLNSMPLSTVAFASNGGAQLTTSPSSITFTPANWNIPVTVTVTAIDDALVESSPHNGNIFFATASSGDPAYNALTPPTMSVQITDNDFGGPGVTVAQSAGSTAVAEGGATDTYTVVLNSPPTANVTITSNPGTQVTVAPTTLTFTPANWNTAQTVTVTAVDDAAVEGAHTGTITHTAASADTNYNAIAIAGVTVNITDNDGVSTGLLYGISSDKDLISIDPLTAKGTLIGPMGTFTGHGGIGFRGSKLYVWGSSSKRIHELNIATGTAISNIDIGVKTDGDEGDMTFRSDGIGFLADIAGLSRFDITVPNSTFIASIGTKIDGLAFNSAGVLYALAEGGKQLYTMDPATAKITLVGSTGIVKSFSYGGLVFDSAGNLYAVLSSGPSELYKIDPVTANATFIGSLGFSFVECLAAQGTPTPAVNITQSGGSTTVTEGGATDTYTVVLNTAPTANVTVTINPGTQVTVAPATLTFTPANWNTAQTVTVTAVNDVLSEGTHTGTITHSAVSTDTNYNAIAIANVTVTITDNDAPSLNPFQNITVNGDYVAAGVGLRGSTSGNITLAGIPVGATVTTAYLYWGMLDNGESPTLKNLTFAGTPITGTLIGSGPDTSWGRTNSHAYRADVTSLVAGNGTFALSGVATGGNILANGASVVAVWTKTGSPPRTLIIVDGNVVLSGVAATTTITGFTAPAAAVNARTTYIVADGQTFNENVGFTGTLGTLPLNNSLNGSDGNYWDTDTYDVSAQIGPSSTTASATINATSDALAWVAQVFSVGATVTPAGVTITQSGGTTVVAEGGATDTYTVVLNSAPTANVTITLNPGTQLTAAPATLTFTPANWNTAQTVTVTAVDDAAIEGPHTGTIKHTAASADPAYNGIAVADVTANITDNEAAPPGTLYGITYGTGAKLLTINTTTGVGTAVGPVSLTTSYGINFRGPKLYSAEFNGVTTDVFELDPATGATTNTIKIGATSILGEGDMIFQKNGIGLLTNIVAPVRLTRFDISVPNASTVGPMTAAIDGLAFNNAGVLYGLDQLGRNLYTIDPSSGALTLVGSTGIVKYAVNAYGGLAFDSTGNLYAGLSPIPPPFGPGGPSELYKIDPATGTGTFIGIIGIDSICGLCFSPVAGVSVFPSGGSTDVAEGGATDTYTVVLNTAPTANVTITINPGTQTTAAPTTLTFTPANWSVPQTVTVTAVDDAAIEGPHTGTISHSATSTDTKYNAIAIANVTANITDNDVVPAGVIITQSGGTTAVAEGGATDTYTVVLNSAPTANVTITLNPGAQVTVAPAVLTFTPANWNTAQTVTVTAVNDLIVEGPHTGTITHTAASADATYNAIVIASVVANITDNDTASVTVTQSAGTTSVTEGGPTDSYTVVLTSPPTANVTITISTGTQMTAAPATLTFTPANWNTPQTVVVTAVNDTVYEGPQTGTITHTATSTDLNYNAIAIAAVAVSIVDDEPVPPPDAADTSEVATHVGTLSGPKSYANLDTFRKPNGKFDDDWYAWTMGKNGTFSVDLKNISVVASGPNGKSKFGDLHMRIYRVVNGNLIEIGSTQVSGSKILSAAAAQNERILVWVYGLYFTQATYDLSVDLK